MRKELVFVLTGGMLLLSGCANVEPADRGTLAMSSMQLDPYLMDTTFTDHAFFAREGTSGAFGASAGGCGCN